MIDEIVERLKRYPEVLAIILFGSYAKGEQKPLSDIDIAVILDEISPDIEGEVGSLSSRTVDIVFFHRLPPYFKYEILRTGRYYTLRMKKNLGKSF